MTKEEEIIKFSRQLHDVAFYSESWEKCVEKAVDEIMGNAEVSKTCAVFDIIKKELIDYLTERAKSYLTIKARR